MDWNHEEVMCVDSQARTITFHDEGETERVPLTDVFGRRAWFPEGGLYILRDSHDRPMYVGMTRTPIRLRLTWHLASKRTWAKADLAGWTVAMRRLPPFGQELAALRALRASLRPVFNITGRPRKRQREQVYCACRGVCPRCGLPRVPAGE